MLTKNAKTLIAALLFRSYATPGTIKSTSGVVVRLTDLASSGSSCAYSSYALLSSALNTLQNTGGVGVSVAKDGAEPSIDDYVLPNPLSTSEIQSKSSVPVTINYYSDYAEVSATYPLTNQTKAPITVTNIGAVIQIRGTAENSSSTSYYYMLFDHTKLVTPVIIQAGETKSVTYTIRINLS